ncbi:hypothetical protein PUNSTDRAFT_142590 [Punctularia strigosozonata HHB-11173 SS5]|uniref:uncharacterized protein n=1 Tax=Punctularia strigosozonata (strain HHB-11173) TaxID=741275 RepID=UPI0004416C46|nr:uncharacterized protein PUNSTDRAFT_142590 [Punctularia strigosozonata HHB-11173 SS5]EIN10616.1 hypothetical protein PUNSTDRAFT_142590 [Punctularia strigosozonata HHB-11173 SS5]
MRGGVLERRDDIDLEHHDSTSHTFLYIFVTLQLVGGLGLLVLLLTVILSKTVQRQATWVSFIASWVRENHFSQALFTNRPGQVISSVSYTLLAFFRQSTGAEPHPALCFIQAALIYGSPVLTAYTALSLVLELLINARDLFLDKRKLARLLLVVVPYVLYIVALLEASLVGLARKDEIKRLPSGIYCSNSSGVPGSISGALVILGLAATLLSEIVLGLEFYRARRAFGFLQEPETKLPMSMFIRLAIFTVFAGLAIGISVAFTFHSTELLPNMCLALMPVATLLTFTQMDIIRAWKWWTKAPSYHGRRYSETPLLLETTPRSESFNFE